MLLFKNGFLLGLIALLCFGCAKPTEDIKIVVDTNVIKYSVLVHVTDAGNPGFAPTGLTMTVTGQDAGDIYEIAGKKNFTITDGIITIGSGPALTPTADKPIVFDVNLSAPGYIAVTKTMKFVPGQLQQVVEIVMANGDEPAVASPAIVQTAAATTPVTLNFIGLCANKSNFELLPSIYLFYRETGSKAGYAYLGYMDKGVITANLVMGKTYDFKLTYAAVNYVVTQKIEQGSYTESVMLGDICSNF